MSKETNPINKPTHPQNTIWKDVINTPYLKVLSIWNEAKRFINIVSKTQSKWIRDLEWSIKVITSHSLYTYEVSDNECIKKYEAENPSFKQFVEFVSDYNKEVIEVNKKNTFLITQTQKMNSQLGILQEPSFKANRKVGIAKKIVFKQPNKLINSEMNTKVSFNTCSTGVKIMPGNAKYIMKDIMYSLKTPTNAANNIHGRKNNFSLCVNNTVGNYSFSGNSIQHKLTNYQRNVSNPKGDIFDREHRQRFHTPSNTEVKLQKYSYWYLESTWSKANYDTKQICTKEFNIFEWKQWIGHTNVLPVMGRTIIETFGINDKMINMSKWDTFLMAVSNSYFTSVLYHNSLHGADVTHTIALFFLNSNAEEVGSTSMWDILSILIAALGHDIGHPGLTNGFQINSSSDIALTHNDWSCLENYHCARWFKLERVPENHIFETWSVADYKTWRKRMISMILATDMANHGKVMSVISALVPKDLNNKEGKIEILTRNDNNKMFEEQQALLDYFIHSADWAHNTKQFKLSLQWVELLSKEFWSQGDKEKSMNLPVSFLCERVGSDIPKSQIGFIKGFILPTFDVWIQMFPSLEYTVDNAKENLRRWQEWVDQGRKTGWSPKKGKDRELIFPGDANEYQEDCKDEHENNDDCKGEEGCTQIVKTENAEGCSINNYSSSTYNKGTDNFGTSSGNSQQSQLNTGSVQNANWGKPKFIIVQKNKASPSSEPLWNSNGWPMGSIQKSMTNPKNRMIINNKK